MNKALGLIETIGLVSAIEAADAAVKAAKVILLGYENTKGGGKITVKLAGDVGAVKAAVAAGVAAAERVGQVYGSLVIPRPHAEIDILIRQVDRGQASLLGELPVEPVPDYPAMPTVPVVEPEPLAEPEAESPAEPEEKPQPRRCIAITKTGEQCKLPARPGLDYCVFHRKLDQAG